MALRNTGPMRTAIMSLATCSSRRMPASKCSVTISRTHGGAGRAAGDRPRVRRESLAGVLLPLVQQSAAGGRLRGAGADAMAERIGGTRTGRVQIGQPEAADHLGPDRMALAAAPADVGAEPLVQGSRHARRRPREADDDRRPGPEAARDVLDNLEEIALGLVLILPCQGLRAPVRRARAAGEPPPSRSWRGKPGGDGGEDGPE